MVANGRYNQNGSSYYNGFSLVTRLEVEVDHLSLKKWWIWWHWWRCNSGTNVAGESNKNGGNGTTNTGGGGFQWHSSSNLEIDLEVLEDQMEL